MKTAKLFAKILILVLVVFVFGAQNASAQTAPAVNIWSPKTDLPYGYTTDLFWTSPRATSCVATGGTNGWAGSKYHGGGSFYTEALYQTVTFTLTCSNSYGSATDSVTIFVAGGPVTFPTVNFTADNTNVAYNSATTLRWNTTNATSCNASGGASGWSGSKAIPSGTFNTGPLTYTTTYTLSCSNQSGSETKSITLNVGNQQTSNPTVTTQTATNVSSNSATLNGFVNANGANLVYAWFEWGLGGNTGNQTGKVSYGSTSGTTYSYALGGLAPNSTYSFRAVAESSTGQIVYGNTLTFFTTSGGSGNLTTPSVSTYSATNIGENYATLNGYVDPNGSYTTRWFEWSTNSSNLANTTNKIAQGTSAGNFNQYISGLAPNSVYYFRAVAQNQHGTIYGNVLTFNTLNGGINYGDTCQTGSCAPTAVTTVATNVDHNSARVNGLALVTGGVSTNGYFEWGTTTNLGNTTTLGFVGSGSSSPFYASLFGLQQNTTYYFRAVVQNQYGTSRGDIRSFRTGSITIINESSSSSQTNIIYRDRQVVTNVVDVNAGTGITKPSSVFLSVSRNNEVVRRGGLIDYVVYYKNVSTKNLKDVVLTVTLPKELSFVDTTRGYFSAENNAVVVNIGTLNPGEEGSVRVNTELTGSIEAGKIIVVTAHLAYTIVADNAQEEVFAYSKNTIGEDGSNLAGTALFAGGFWPTTLIGWLLLFLLALIFVLVIKRLLSGSNRPTMQSQEAYNRNTNSSGGAL